MKRDMDLVRKIMLAIENKPDLDTLEIKLPNENAASLKRHIDLLYAAGFIDGIRYQSGTDPDATLLVKGLSWKGHEFLDTIREKRFSTGPSKWLQWLISK